MLGDPGVAGAVSSEETLSIAHWTLLLPGPAGVFPPWRLWVCLCPKLSL